MKFEQAINFVECRQNHECSSEISQNWGGVIKCLEEGEKYKKMWEEAKGYPESHKSLVLPDEYRGYIGGALKYIIETTEQKYFPKPKSKLVKLKQALDKAVRELLEEVN